MCLGNFLSDPVLSGGLLGSEMEICNQKIRAKIQLKFNFKLGTQLNLRHITIFQIYFASVEKLL